MVNEETIAIIMSDVHLGAIGSNKAQFYSFLKRLSAHPKLSIILAGDFIDLMCESVPKIDKECSEIFSLLHSLQENGTKIFYILGNHEIPATPPYETNPASLTHEVYHEREADLKSRLDTASPLKDFLQKIKMGQYAVLENAGDSWDVHMFESISQVQTNPDSKVQALITHGFQFERTTPAASEIWKNALAAPNSLKDLIDFFYNGAVVSVRNVFSPDRWDAGPETIKTTIQTHKKLQKYPAESKMLLQMIDEQPAQLRQFSEGYLQTMAKRHYTPLPAVFQDIRTLLKNNQNLKEITHVLFGHTHEMQVDEGPEKTTIINTGAWQHVEKMTYIEVDNKGNFQPKFIRSRTYWIYVLIGICLLAGLIYGILWLILNNFSLG